jgi:amino acid adenylation domain-containing protein
MLVGILGILKAGGAYVPIDPSYPTNRIDYILSDTNARIVVSHSEARSNFTADGKSEFIELDTDWHSISGQPSSNPAIPIHANNMAYVIYTSGSTGKPKGVMIEHRSLTNYLLNSKTNYIKPGSNSSGTFMHLSYTFDASVTGIFMPLLYGKSIIIASGDSIDMFDEKNLQGYAPYDFIKATPAHLELLQPKIKIGDQLLTNKLVIGGEALFLSHFSQIIEDGIDIEVVNEYGPTEATVGCCTYTFTTIGDSEKIKNKILIGKPIDNIQLYVLDSNLELVPIGIPGEICLGGIGLARGYLNQPALTAERFIENPFAEKSERIYRTGDLGRWLADGNIEYLGRKDDQVKIRGYRIELGEIESVLLEFELVEAAVVLAKDDSFGNKNLVGCIVPNGLFNKDEIIANLKNRLPEYMIPTRWVKLESLPLTSNGKIDKKALLAYDASEGTNGQHEGPRNEIEKSLLEIWKDILEVDQVGIHDDLFDLGGHSLLVIRLISIIRKELEVELTINDLFQFTTISELSKYIELQKGSKYPEKDVTEFDLLNI